MPVKPYDARALFQLWNDHTLRPEEVARRLGISMSMLRRAAAHHHLPSRPAWRDRSENYAPSEGEDLASGESLRLSPWVQARINELRIGLPA